MTNQLFGYSTTYSAAPLPSASSGYTPPSISASSTIARYLRARSDPLDSSSDLPHYSLTSSMYLSPSKSHIYSSSSSSATGRAIAAAAAAAAAAWPPPPGVDVPSSVDSLVVGSKRSSDALYHQTLLGAYNTIGQSEAWYSTYSLAKRPRYESARNLPIYPQRPGEKDCAHYMLTRTCKFGDTCKFDHPVWVPEGGIPDWKEVPSIASSESFPERPGEPDCPYFLKTQRCKYGVKCKFNHPKQKMALGTTETSDVSTLPERPTEPPCAFYMKTGKCKFGATCKFNHPKDVQIPLSGQGNGTIEKTESAVTIEGMAGEVNGVKASVSVTPALFHNSKGLPLRQGEVDCPFYLKTGSCKYGATCRYNHPDWSVINPTSAIGHPLVPSVLNIGVVNPASSIFQTLDPRLTPMLTMDPTVYPQRPEQTECDYYMKTGVCKFGERCKFHHPIDRSAPPPNAQQESVKLTLAGLPRREGAVHCPYYMKTGTCKYGATCKFDHPPPGEVIAAAVSQGKSTSVGTEAKATETEPQE
ncbi:Zinc finger CCCH domain-containing protein 37 [Turnera subulata]|uniref:Zinc finger CCCH domain-containing protein 37 n=1 Tax=Turnera subulata TaxID=218843 RepID=A0A9Q0FDV9_9ROSI|nr:Zinc finger CCCH domain-containing protein 37 [Turnera subulata]